MVRFRYLAVVELITIACAEVNPPPQRCPGLHCREYLGKPRHRRALQQLLAPFLAETAAGEAERLSTTGTNAGPAQLCLTGRQLGAASCVTAGRAGEEDVGADGRACRLSWCLCPALSSYQPRDQAGVSESQRRFRGEINAISGSWRFYG